MGSLLRQLKELQIHPKKRLGQHFVIDRTLLAKITSCADLDPQDVVLEIGAGPGGLTTFLAQGAQKVYAVEVDPRLAGVLREQFKGNESVEVILADALQIDFAPLFQRGQRRMKVVANLPYEITSPMLFRLFAERHYFSLLVLMLQMEVARRIVALPSTKDYGPLSLWSRLYTQAEIVFPVSPQAFHPPPRVKSAVVRFKILPQPRIEVGDERALHRVIRSAFAYRRKILANALQLGEFPHLPTNTIQETLESIGLDPHTRGEALSLEQFRDLSQILGQL